MERDKGIDWDKEIAGKEEEYRKGLWGSLAKRSMEIGCDLVLDHGVDPVCDEILTKIEAEYERTNKDGFSAEIDQEMYWRFTGHYPVFVYGEGDSSDEGK